MAATLCGVCSADILRYPYLTIYAPGLWRNDGYHVYINHYSAGAAIDIPN
eukprot:CAMPEP_0172497132 /NCGR_PEP_ID=MMETSP1066-20121228/95693_1 /TAXON_ID=671091 /ORGANISM="Coscinodiscus wailesii, Strain CCMP2513" /LENGTH=49 /DNA_ID= /DNA_START= /DNA_END= /DNA_ORIENTATION=